MTDDLPLSDWLRTWAEAADAHPYVKKRLDEAIAELKRLQTENTWLTAEVERLRRALGMES